MCEAPVKCVLVGGERTMAQQRRKGHAMSAYASHALCGSGAAIWCLPQCTVFVCVHVQNFGNRQQRGNRADHGGHGICVHMPCWHWSATDCPLTLNFLVITLKLLRTQILRIVHSAHHPFFPALRIHSISPCPVPLS